jgi:hypothetical protein
MRVEIAAELESRNVLVTKGGPCHIKGPYRSRSAHGLGYSTQNPICSYRLLVGVACIIISVL